MYSKLCFSASHVITWIAPLSFIFLDKATAQSCGVTSSYATPKVADGWQAQLLTKDLKIPRSLLFDSNGNLVVLQSKIGVTVLSIREGNGGCLEVSNKKDVISNTDLNHGLELSPDGKTIYASSTDSVFSWGYDAANLQSTSQSNTLVTNMANPGHSTRTIRLLKSSPNNLLVQWGSGGNIDPLTRDIKSGISQIKVFDISNVNQPYNYAESGQTVGWGLRNSVGIAEEPNTGGIYAVENSVDNMERNGVDIHTDNPGEEMNSLGTLEEALARPTPNNYGYPDCFTVWDTKEIPDSGTLDTGSPFAIGNLNDTNNDSICQSKTVGPAITFQAHMAPLDIKFNNSAAEAWIAFHGSWNRDSPVGYKLSYVEFANGSPKAAKNSKSAAIDVLTNPDNSKCPDACFRPAGIAFDNRGRLFMASDSTGEIWVVQRAPGSTSASSLSYSTSSSSSLYLQTLSSTENGVISTSTSGLPYSPTALDTFVTSVSKSDSTLDAYSTTLTSGNTYFVYPSACPLHYHHQSSPQAYMPQATPKSD